VRDVPGRVMIPAYARPAHHRLRAKLAEIAAWNEATARYRLSTATEHSASITSGISYQHVREAAPRARVLKVGLTYPLPVEAMRRFAASVDRALVVEEGDPYLYEGARTAGIAVEQKPEMYRFGELNVSRVRRIVAGDVSPEPALPVGKPPELCPGCPHRNVFEALRDLGCIVAATSAATHWACCAFFPPGHLRLHGRGHRVGLGLRHSLPPEQSAQGGQCDW